VATSEFSLSKFFAETSFAGVETGSTLPPFTERPDAPIS